MYADDTVLLAYGTDWKNAKLNAEASLRSTISWLSLNLLTLNLEKTKVIAFRLSPRSAPIASEANITAHRCSSSPCTCPSIPLVTYTKYLGICIDERLNWHPQIEMLKTRVRRLIYIFKSLRESANKQIITLVYLALCQSILSYCIPVWGGTDKTTLLGLERAQRAILKVMTNKPIRFPTVALYTECKVLSVRKLFILRTLLRKHSSVPLDKSITTRPGKPVCQLVKFRTCVARRQHIYLASKLYNDMNKLVPIHSLNKYKLKMELSNYLMLLSYDETEKLLVRVN